MQPVVAPHWEQYWHRLVEDARTQEIDAPTRRKGLVQYLHLQYTTYGVAHERIDEALTIVETELKDPKDQAKALVEIATMMADGKTELRSPEQAEEFFSRILTLVNNLPWFDFVPRTCGDSFDRLKIICSALIANTDDIGKVSAVIDAVKQIKQMGDPIHPRRVEPKDSWELQRVMETLIGCCIEHVRQQTLPIDDAAVGDGMILLGKMSLLERLAKTFPAPDDAFLRMQVGRELTRIGSGAKHPAAISAAIKVIGQGVGEGGVISYCEGMARAVENFGDAMDDIPKGNIEEAVHLLLEIDNMLCASEAVMGDRLPVVMRQYKRAYQTIAVVMAKFGMPAKNERLLKRVCDIARFTAGDFDVADRTFLYWVTSIVGGAGADGFLYVINRAVERTLR